MKKGRTIKKNSNSREETDSYTRLLDAAEQLFAQKGYNGVSVREITSLAKVNLGSVSYYMGNKENLLEQVVRRRSEPIRLERERLYAELLQNNAVTPASVVEAMLLPAFRASEENIHFRRLFGRAALDPTPEVQAVLHRIYSRENITIPTAIYKACPGLSDLDYLWRLNCFYGVMIFIQADIGMIQTVTDVPIDTSDYRSALKYVVPFLTAALEAKPVKT